ncbi:hypothetical protein DFH09DRAFT_915102, partial [Mycena vulgaris]
LKIGGVTITLAHLLQHSKALGIRAILLGPESGLVTNLSRNMLAAEIFGTFGFPLKAYRGLKINFIPPSFINDLQELNPDVIHLVDPIWLGVQALAVFRLLFPGISQDTNLPSYATVFSFPYFRHRIWRISSYVHSFARFTLVPSLSTAHLLHQKGFVNLSICNRGVNPRLFNVRDFNNFGCDLTLCSAWPLKPVMGASWGMKPGDVAILSVGRLSLENLPLLTKSFALLSRDIRDRAVLVFVGEGPLAHHLQRLCVA